ASLRYRKAELAALFEEKRALLSELLGSEVALEMPAILAEAPGSRNGAAYLSVPEAKRAAVRAIHERYRAAVGRIRAESFGSLSEDDVQKLDTLRKEQRSALAGLLTTDELTDFDLGTSNLAGWLKSQFRGAALTQEELRSVFRRFQGSIDAASLAVLGEGLDLGKASAELLATGGPAEELFGEARTAELRRARDPIYRMYQAAFVRAGIPDEVLNQVYEVQRAAIQDSNRRIYDSATSVQERQRLMEESQETARKSLRDVVGEEAFQRLVEGGTLPFLRVGRSKSTPP
ncbi:MAG TPA: hypothetical protein DCE44_17450, partial [Verrucomicrobiales bacterium]|nr:hypothetical protein [Verrucomicrobiales bacterium]